MSRVELASPGTEGGKEDPAKAVIRGYLILHGSLRTVSRFCVLDAVDRVLLAYTVDPRERPRTGTVIARLEQCQVYLDDAFSADCIAIRNTQTGSTQHVGSNSLHDVLLWLRGLRRVAEGLSAEAWREFGAIRVLQEAIPRPVLEEYARVAKSSDPSRRARRRRAAKERKDGGSDACVETVLPPRLCALQNIRLLITQSSIHVLATEPCVKLPSTANEEHFRVAGTSRLEEIDSESEEDTDSGGEEKRAGVVSGGGGEESDEKYGGIRRRSKRREVVEEVVDEESGGPRKKVRARQPSGPLHRRRRSARNPSEVLAHESNRVFHLSIDRLKTASSDLSALVREETLRTATAEQLVSEVRERSAAGGKDAFEELVVPAVLGTVRFVTGHYLVLATDVDRVGVIGAHDVFVVRGHRLLRVQYRTPEAMLSPWQWLTGRLSTDVVEVLESRYRTLFETVLDGGGFYFSPTYDLSRTLQAQIGQTLRPQKIPAADSPGSVEPALFRKSSGLGPSVSLVAAASATPPRDQFVWTAHLAAELSACTSAPWCQPLVHGYFRQATLVTAGGRSMRLSLVARRSSKFAGTRYLKRGVASDGFVANDVEVEQILDDGQGGFASYVQMRGSVPVPWSQRANLATPRPPIVMLPTDPARVATARHFANLMERYGPTQLVLNLLRKREKTPRETLVGAAFAAAVRQVNRQLPPPLRIQYLSLDFAALARSPRHNVVDALRDAARWAVPNTGITVVRPGRARILPARAGAPTYPVLVPWGVRDPRCTQQSIVQEDGHPKKYLVEGDGHSKKYLVEGDGHPKKYLVEGDGHPKKYLVEGDGHSKKYVVQEDGHSKKYVVESSPQRLPTEHSSSAWPGEVEPEDGTGAPPCAVPGVVPFGALGHSSPSRAIERRAPGVGAAPRLPVRASPLQIVRGLTTGRTAPASPIPSGFEDEDEDAYRQKEEDGVSGVSRQKDEDGVSGVSRRKEDGVSGSKRRLDVAVPEEPFDRRRPAPTVGSVAAVARACAVPVPRAVPHRLRWTQPTLLRAMGLAGEKEVRPEPGVGEDLETMDVWTRPSQPLSYWRAVRQGGGSSVLLEADVLWAAGSARAQAPLLLPLTADDERTWVAVVGEEESPWSRRDISSRRRAGSFGTASAGGIGGGMGGLSGWAPRRMMMASALAELYDPAGPPTGWVGRRPRLPLESGVDRAPYYVAVCAGGSAAPADGGVPDRAWRMGSRAGMREPPPRRAEVELDIGWRRAWAKAGRYRRHGGVGPVWNWERRARAHRAAIVARRRSVPESVAIAVEAAGTPVTAPVQCMWKQPLSTSSTKYIAEVLADASERSPSRFSSIDNNSAIQDSSKSSTTHFFPDDSRPPPPPPPSSSSSLDRWMRSFLPWRVRFAVGGQGASRSEALMISRAARLPFGWASPSHLAPPLAIDVSWRARLATAEAERVARLQVRDSRQRDTQHGSSPNSPSLDSSASDFARVTRSDYVRPSPRPGTPASSGIPQAVVALRDRNFFARQAEKFRQANTQAALAAAAAEFLRVRSTAAAAAATGLARRVLACTSTQETGDPGTEFERLPDVRQIARLRAEILRGAVAPAAIQRELRRQRNLAKHALRAAAAADDISSDPDLAARTTPGLAARLRAIEAVGGATDATSDAAIGDAAATRASQQGYLYVDLLAADPDRVVAALRVLGRPGGQSLPHKWLRADLYLSPGTYQVALPRPLWFPVAPPESDELLAWKGIRLRPRLVCAPAEFGGRCPAVDLSLDVGSQRQSGVLRTNCVDCLDRTNLAQTVVGVHALGAMLRALGVDSLEDGEAQSGDATLGEDAAYEMAADVDEFRLEREAEEGLVADGSGVHSMSTWGALPPAWTDPSLCAAETLPLRSERQDLAALRFGADAAQRPAQVLMDMFEEMGDALSLQYGGSAAHKKVSRSETSGEERAASEAERRRRIGGREASSTLEILTSVRRYYSNSFTDFLKQDALNLFLGRFRAQQGESWHLWDLESDHMMHNPIIPRQLSPPVRPGALGDSTVAHVFAAADYARSLLRHGPRRDAVRDGTPLKTTKEEGVSDEDSARREHISEDVARAIVSDTVHGRDWWSVPLAIFAEESLVLSRRSMGVSLDEAVATSLTMDDKTEVVSRPRGRTSELGRMRTIRELGRLFARGGLHTQRLFGLSRDAEEAAVPDTLALISSGSWNRPIYIGQRSSNNNTPSSSSRLLGAAAAATSARLGSKRSRRPPAPPLQSSASSTSTPSPTPTPTPTQSPSVQNQPPRVWSNLPRPVAPSWIQNASGITYSPEKGVRRTQQGTQRVGDLVRILRDAEVARQQSPGGKVADAAWDFPFLGPASMRRVPKSKAERDTADPLEVALARHASSLPSEARLFHLRVVVGSVYAQKERPPVPKSSSFLQRWNETASAWMPRHPVRICLLPSGAANGAATLQRASLLPRPPPKTPIPRPTTTASSASRPEGEADTAPKLRKFEPEEAIIARNVGCAVTPLYATHAAFDATIRLGEHAQGVRALIIRAAQSQSTGSVTGATSDLRAVPLAPCVMPETDPNDQSIYARSVAAGRLPKAISLQQSQTWQRTNQFFLEPPRATTNLPRRNMPVSYALEDGLWTHSRDRARDFGKQLESVFHGL